MASVLWLVRRNPRGFTSAAQGGLARTRGLEGQLAPPVCVGVGNAYIGACIRECECLWLLADLLCAVLAVCLGKSNIS